ncbi:MAG: hypothetical protein ACTMIA_13810 [Vibrio sp.]
MTNPVYCITGSVIACLLLTTTLDIDIITRYADHLSLLAFMPSIGILCYGLFDHIDSRYLHVSSRQSSQRDMQWALRHLCVQQVPFKAIFKGDTMMLVPKNVFFDQIAQPSEKHHIYVLQLTMDKHRKVVHCSDRFIHTSDAITIETLERCFSEPARCSYSKFTLSDEYEQDVSLSANIIQRQLKTLVNDQGWSLKSY